MIGPHYTVWQDMNCIRSSPDPQSPFLQKWAWLAGLDQPIQWLICSKEGATPILFFRSGPGYLFATKFHCFAAQQYKAKLVPECTDLKTACINTKNYETDLLYRNRFTTWVGY